MNKAPVKLTDSDLAAIELNDIAESLENEGNTDWYLKMLREQELGWADWS